MGCSGMIRQAAAKEVNAESTATYAARPLSVAVSDKFMKTIFRFGLERNGLPGSIPFSLSIKYKESLEETGTCSQFPEAHPILFKYTKLFPTVN